jgi:hypothetical protein
MRSALITVGLLMISSSADAQQSSKDALARLGIKIVEPMSAKEMAATKSRVASELARSGTAALFDDISDATGGRVRHRASGLVCPLGKKGQRVLAASSDAVACETSNGSAVYKTNVARAPAGATLESVAAAALAEAQRERGYTPYGGLSVIARHKEGSGRPDHRTFRYLSRVGGPQRVSQVQIGLVRDWILVERRETSKTTAQQPFTMSDLLSEATFGLSMRQQ